MRDPKDVAREELLVCLELWEKQGFCAFGKKTNCQTCGAPYLLYKLCTGNVLHEERLSFEQWKQLLNSMP